MAKLVWCVKLVGELRSGTETEVEIARLERGAQAGLADLGLRLAEAKRPTAALQAEMVLEQVAEAGERRRAYEVCGRGLAGKGHYGATFRSLFGDVPVRVRRLLACPCQSPQPAEGLRRSRPGQRRRGRAPGLRIQVHATCALSSWPR